MQNLEIHLSAKSHIIWDWNGTLIDDAWICAESLGDMLVEHGLPTLSFEEHRRRFRMPVQEFYRELGFDFEKVPFETLSQKFAAGYKARVAQARLFPGTQALLSSLEGAGKKMAVLSAARETDLRRHIEHLGIHHHFDHIYGLSDYQAASKVARGHELVKTWNANPKSLILVGDMDHDREVATALGIEVILLEDGHQELTHRREELGVPLLRRSGLVVKKTPP